MYIKCFTLRAHVQIDYMLLPEIVFLSRGIKWQETTSIWNNGHMAILQTNGTQAPDKVLHLIKIRFRTDTHINLHIGCIVITCRNIILILDWLHFIHSNGKMTCVTLKTEQTKLATHLPRATACASRTIATSTADKNKTVSVELIMWHKLNIKVGVLDKPISVWLGARWSIGSPAGAYFTPCINIINLNK